MGRLAGHDVRPCVKAWGAGKRRVNGLYIPQGTLDGRPWYRHHKACQKTEWKYAGPWNDRVYTEFWQGCYIRWCSTTKEWRIYHAVEQAGIPNRPRRRFRRYYLAPSADHPDRALS